MKIAVIGGGASGITAAIFAKRENPLCKVVVFEKNDRILKKIHATGNGRCNFTNRNIDKFCYYGSCSNLSSISTDYNIENFFASLGVYSYADNEGRVYFKSVNGNDPLGKPYIFKNGEYIELERCLLAYEGITAEQIDAMITDEVEGTDEDDLGIVWAVSGDGKTLIGAGGALKGNIWCAKLSCSPYDVDPVVAVENVTYDNLAAYYANGAITIKGNAEMIEVYSITGAKVMSQNIENNSIKANLRNGIYVVKIYNGNNVATSKIIVK